MASITAPWLAPGTPTSRATPAGERVTFPAYLAFTDPITLTRILAANGGCDVRFIPRVLVLYLVSVVLLPFNWLERLLYGRRVAEQRLRDNPLVILGHDRSGTTHLLNLLSLDPQFAYTRPSQMVFPGCCILFDRLMDAFLRRIDYRRPFDAMEVGPGSPQDDEVPMVKLTPHCEYHKYSFPRRYRYWLDTYVFGFSAASPAYAEWKRTYLGTLRKAALLMGRERSLLKSPATMANLNVVLELWRTAVQKRTADNGEKGYSLPSSWRRGHSGFVHARENGEGRTLCGKPRARNGRGCARGWGRAARRPVGISQEEGSEYPLWRICHHARAKRPVVLAINPRWQQRVRCRPADFGSRGQARMGGDRRLIGAGDTGGRPSHGVRLEVPACGWGRHAGARHLGQLGAHRVPNLTFDVSPQGFGIVWRPACRPRGPSRSSTFDSAGRSSARRCRRRGRPIPDLRRPTLPT